MLQHNSASAQAGKKAHIAHATMVSLHALCCGLPALALTVAALSGATSGATLFAGATARFHALMHAHELWILVMSAALVVVGGSLELRARHGAPGRGFPVLFALSAACFVLNATIILVHRAV